MRGFDKSTAGTGGSSDFVSLKEDGDSATFFVPEGNEIVESLKVWEGGKSRDANAGDEPASIVRKFAVNVTVDGKAKKLEQGNAFWKRFRAAIEKVGGDLYSHTWEVERIGEKGDKNTVYRFKATGKAPVQVIPTAAEKAAVAKAANKAANDVANKVFGISDDDERAAAMEG